MITRVRTLFGISVFWLALSMLGDGFATLVVPQRVSVLVDPASAATAIGLVTFVGLLAGMLVQPVAGAASDALYPRWGRRGLLLVGVALVLTTLGAFAMLDTLPGVLVAFVLLQLAANVAQAAQQGFIPDLIAPDWRGRAAAVKGLADLGGAFFGFLLLGALLTDGDAVPAVIAVAIVVTSTALITVALVPETSRARGEPRSVSFRAVYRIDVRTHRAFVRVVVARFLFLLGTYAVGRFFLLFVADRLGLHPSTAADEAGGLLAVLTLITAVAALPTGWLADRTGRPRTMIAGAALSAAGALLLLAAGSAATIVLFGALMAVGSAAFSSANWAMAADLVPRRDSARLLGIANFGTAGAAAAAGLFGPLTDALRAASPGLGYGGVLVAAVVPFALSALVTRPLLRSPAHLASTGIDGAKAEDAPPLAFEERSS